MRFRNRQHAGQLLAKKLKAFKSDKVVVYALPRGGVVLGVEVARELGAPLDLVIPRKIGHPLYEEYAIGAVTESGHLVANQTEVDEHDPKWLKEAILLEQAEAQRRRVKYLEGRPEISTSGKIAIVVDDGIATGLTMLAAIKELTDKRPSRIIVAVPVLPQDTLEQLKHGVDEVVALDIPEIYAGAVGAYYNEFNQVEDEEVIRLMDSLQSAKNVN